MDTFKDKQHLEDLNLGGPPWKVWHAARGLPSSAPVAKVA
jgi:hypothetical protein